MNAIGSAGVVNAIHPYRDREAAWWFFVTGLLYLSLCVTIAWIQRQGLKPPAFRGGRWSGRGASK